MVLGTLRDQLLYPTWTDLTDEVICSLSAYTFLCVEALDGFGSKVLFYNVYKLHLHAGHRP